MGMFDFNWSDPNMMAMLGAISGLGQAAAPSRLPVPLGMAMGGMFSGAAQGAQQGQQYRLNQQKLQTGQAALTGANIQNASALATANFWRQLNGLAPLDANGNPAQSNGGGAAPAATSIAPDGAPAENASPQSVGVPSPVQTKSDDMNRNVVNSIVQNLDDDSQAELTRRAGGQTDALGLLKLMTPPGMTLPQFALYGLMNPGGAAGVANEWLKPQNLREGNVLLGRDAQGNVAPVYQNPKIPDNNIYDPGTNSVVPINGALGAAGLNAATIANAQLPAKQQEIAAQGEQTRTTAAYQRGLEMGTTLVPSYDPTSQRTTMITQADALRLARSGAPISSPPPGAPPPQPGGIGLQGDGSYLTPSGTIIPSPPRVPTRTGGYQTTPSAADAATQAGYAETIKAWNDSVQPAIQAEQRFQAMAEALKATQSGAWANVAGTIGNHLLAAGFDPATVRAMTNVDPAQAQIVLKNNFGASLSQLASSRLGRITQNEIFALQKNLANPELRPEANLAIIGQGIGIARYQQSLANDWNTARQLGYADPFTYQAQWTKANPLQGFIDQATKEVGPLKGMPGAPIAPTRGASASQALPRSVLPPNALLRLKQGQVTRFSNGTAWTLQNGQPVQVQ